MLFENNDYMDLDMFLKNANIYDSSDNNVGFMRGNMFDNEFKPYKNMEYVKITPKGKREELLYKIYASSFAIIDYNLYLDVNPTDMEILSKYNNECNILSSLKEEYEKEYGPLCNTKGGYDTFKWISSPWPWEKDGDMYV